jgi:hypothetical protein
MTASSKPATEEAHEMLREIRTTAITIIVAGAVATAALVASASSASAALPVRPITSPTLVRAPQPTSTPRVKEAGSAGVGRYTDKVCQAMANAYNAEVEVVEQAAKDGNAKVAAQEAGVAAETYSELSSNCLVVD